MTRYVAGLAPLACTTFLAMGCSTESLQSGAEPAATSAAKAPASSAAINTHRWATRLRAGDGVSLVNEHGDLRARQSGDSGLHYAGVVQKLAGEQREPEFGTRRLPDALQIEVNTRSDWRGRVDASARVPAGSPLDLRTTNGLIEVRTGDNDVKAVSSGGRVIIRTGGRIEAKGETGDMLIVLLGNDYDDDTAGRIETVSGNVELWLQPQANVTLHANAGRGVEIDTDDIGTVVTDTHNAAQLSLGNGAARLDVSTEQGALVVRTLPAAP